jgi:hypothetical protein
VVPWTPRGDPEDRIRLISALSAISRENTVLTWIANIYYLVAAIPSRIYRAAKRYVRAWVKSHGG